MSNGRLTKTLDYESYEAPMMAHALQIAANTALMCGHEGARERLRELLGKVKANVPAEARRFDDEAFAEIGRAMQDVPDDGEVVVGWAPPSWRSQWSKTGFLTVTIGDRRWTSRSADVPKDGSEPSDLGAYLKQIARFDVRVRIEMKEPAW